MNECRYLRHLDAPPTLQGDVLGEETRQRRKLTLLYYINPDWERVHGGCLRLYPKISAGAPADTTAQGQVHNAVGDAGQGHKGQEEEKENYVDIEPLGDRLLIFQSRTIEHEVLPAHALRFSLTMWLY